MVQGLPRRLHCRITCRWLWGLVCQRQWRDLELTVVGTPPGGSWLLACFLAVQRATDGKAFQRPTGIAPCSPASSLLGLIHQRLHQAVDRLPIAGWCAQTPRRPVTGPETSDARSRSDSEPPTKGRTDWMEVCGCRCVLRWPPFDDERVDVEAVYPCGS